MNERSRCVSMIVAHVYQVGIDGQGAKKVTYAENTVHRLPRPSSDGKQVVFVASMGGVSGTLTLLHLVTDQLPPLDQPVLNVFWLQ